MNSIRHKKKGGEHVETMAPLRRHGRRHLELADTAFHALEMKTKAWDDEGYTVVLMEVFVASGKAPRGPATAAAGWREKRPPMSTIAGKTIMKTREEVTYGLVVTWRSSWA